jgi:hypothetical protein
MKASHCSSLDSCRGAVGSRRFLLRPLVRIHGAHYHNCRKCSAIAGNVDDNSSRAPKDSSSTCKREHGPVEGLSSTVEVVRFDFNIIKRYICCMNNAVGHRCSMGS